MDRKIDFRPRGLQQQPRRPVNQQQQQSSGSGEFQPRSTPADANRRSAAPA
jgi:hypothetical protein